MTSHLRAFAPCPRGLEPFLRDELTAAGAQALVLRPGGIAFAGDWSVLMRVSLMSRIATRVLLALGRGAVSHGKRRGAEGEALYRLAREIAWPKWLTPDARLRVDLTVTRAALTDTIPFLTLRVKDAICDALRAHFGRRPNVDKHDPTFRVVVFLDDRSATFYWDTSGAPLYQRGFKTATTAAPLKENLAAGILHLIGWSPQMPLIDPMCGSGTFVLEAAMRAYGIAPGLYRSFAFERWHGLDRCVWQAMQNEMRTTTAKQVATLRATGKVPTLFASDCDPGQVAAARHNWQTLEAAVAQPLPIEWEVAAAERLEPPNGTPAGFWVSNPPYGMRLAETEALAKWYPLLGDALKRRWAGWIAHFITADPQFPKRIGLRATAKWRLDNGQLRCHLLRYPIVAGSATIHTISSPSGASTSGLSGRLL